MEMKQTFISSLRLLAQLAREPVSKDPKVAGGRTYSLREMIVAKVGHCIEFFQRNVSKRFREDVNGVTLYLGHHAPALLSSLRKL
jgi:hypothetical protein